MSDLSKKLTSAALAGLFTVGVMTAGAAFAGEEKNSCTGKDAAKAEANKCKGEAKEANHCNGKDANHCAGKDSKPAAEKAAEEKPVEKK